MGEPVPTASSIKTSSWRGANERTGSPSQFSRATRKAPLLGSVCARWWSSSLDLSLTPAKMGGGHPAFTTPSPGGLTSALSRGRVQEEFQEIAFQTGPLPHTLQL